MSNPFGGDSGGSGAADFSRREQEIMRREAQLEAREKELLKREQGGAGYIPAPNFPPCAPTVYHDIRKEISPEYQSLVRVGFINWIVYSVALIWNTFAVCVYMDVDFQFGFIVLAIVWLILGCPVGFNMSYMSLYKGVKDKSTTSIFWYLVTWGITTLLSILMFIGVPDTGSAGLIMLFYSVDKDKGFATFISGISVGLWGLCIMVCLYVEKRVLMYYQNRGGNAAARKEANREVAKAAVSEAAASV